MSSEVLKQLPSLPDYSAKWEPVEKYEDFQLCEGGGSSGVIGYYGGNSMEVRAAYDFMEGQFRRFKLNPPQRDFIAWCWDQAFYYIDQFDPYALMTGCSDVIKTEEAYYYQYAVSNCGHEWVEVSPNELETFRLWEDGEKSWEILMMHPGLQTYFDHIYDYFKDQFEFIMRDDHQECYQDEWRFISQYGPKTQDLAHLGIWAAIMWMISPLVEAKAWRYEFHPIFRICYDYGSCVLHGWTFYDPNYYERIERKPQTCSECGIEEYCVDLTQSSHTDSRFMCESCLSGGLPFPGRTCGTRLCEHTNCKNHPVFNAPASEKKAARREIMNLAADARFGALRQLEDGRKERDLPGYIKINEIAIAREAQSIANVVGDVLAGLIGPN